MLYGAITVRKNSKGQRILPGTELRWVRLNFEEKYGTKLPTVFSDILQYGSEIR